LIGKTLGHYEILGLLGKGGMGEVYRARDTKLDREVALKLLPPDIRQDPERLARFRREARVLASLNHPNIASIHGLEEDDGQLFLVLELAAGEDLTVRIGAGALPVDEVLSIARQLAHGLEQAHERGVVHRDLKPANVKLGLDGTVKILDFGLARAYLGESAEEGEIGASPTITAAMTAAGTILGTAAYMSPEQARGHEVDRRADIWAFGVILYEMLTGSRLFEGETISDTLAEVLKTEPDMEALPEATPVALRWLVERCLQKRPSKRLRDIGEARILLESDLDVLPASSISGSRVVVVERPRWVMPALAVVTVVALVAGFGLARLLGGPPPQAPPIHATLLPPPGNEIELQAGGHVAISPQGDRVAFVARDTTGTEQIWVRRLDSPAAHALSGTDQASYPFWSPDGRKLAFFAGGKLKKIDATGGVSIAICDAPNGRGGTWTEDDRVLFAFEVRDHLQIVPASGGTPISVTEMDTLHVSHRWPVALKGTDKFIYCRAGDDDYLNWRSIISNADEKTLLTGVGRAMFGDGHLFFGRDDALWARPFDPARGEFTGEEVLVAESVVTASNYLSAAYGVADDGTLVYAAGQVRSSTSVMVIFDQEGNELERFDFDSDVAQDPNLSRDGRYLALAIFPSQGSGDPDVWIRDLDRGVLSRFTTEEGADDPVWGPEGDRIVYSQGGHIIARSAVGAREILWDVNIGYDALPHDWSSDGRFVLASTERNGRNIIVIPADDPESWYPLIENGHFNIHASFSPDVRWVAYMSTESGEPRIYIREFVEGGGTWPVSRDFGIQPRWRGDGSEIYYVGQNGIEVVGANFGPQGPQFSNDRSLFDVNVLGGRSNTHRYGVTPDGERFVIQINPGQEQSGTIPLDIVMGWRRVIGRE
jgi:Tol biopolymer transport system component